MIEGKLVNFASIYGIAPMAYLPQNSSQHLGYDFCVIKLVTYLKTSFLVPVTNLESIFFSIDKYLVLLIWEG